MQPSVLASGFSLQDRTARRWCRDTGFSGGPLTHELVIPEGPDGRPGERLMVASRSLHAPRVGPDGSREDFRVLVDAYGSTLAAVCMRRSAGALDAEEAAWHSLKRFLELGLDSDYVLAPDRIVGERAYRYSGVLRRGVLTDWKLAHAGWLYVIGVFNRAPASERHTTLERALQALETWTWSPVVHS